MEKTEHEDKVSQRGEERGEEIRKEKVRKEDK